MTHATPKETPLKLTDTPNVAQVIRIYRELERQREERVRQNRWYRRLGRALFSSGAQHTTEADATVVAIDQASRAKKRIDASGRVVIDGIGPRDMPSPGTTLTKADLNAIHDSHLSTSRGELK